MFKKCKANCQANDNLYLRGDVFYYMVELPRQDGKRRYFIKSLHTKDYYEALERSKNMKKAVELHTNDTRKLLKRAKELMNRVVFDTVDVNVDNGDGRNITVQQKRISAKTDIRVIDELYDIVVKIYTITDRTLDDDDLKLIADIVNMRVGAENEKLMEMLQTKLNSISTNNPPAADETIDDVLTKWVDSLRNCKTEVNRKKNIVSNMIEWGGLKKADKYMDFCTIDVIGKVCDSIENIKEVKGNTRRKYMRYLKEFVSYAPLVNPVFQNTLPQYISQRLKGVDKTHASEVEGHMPYTDEQLLQIFNPKYDFFKNNEDQFWFVIIALFTGARRNAATTLQYADIMEYKGIKCIQFKENHPIKQLKNDESERILPIAKQMLDMGFWEYVNRRKTRMNAKNADFIFPNCQRPDGDFNTNIVQDGFIQFVKDIGIKVPDGEKYTFHSLRNNASLRLQDIGIGLSYINKIMGWKGQSTMESNYSKRRVPEIKPELDKLRYDFLQPEFDYWKKVMSKK